MLRTIYGTGAIWEGVYRDWALFLKRLTGPGGPFAGLLGCADSQQQKDAVAKSIRVFRLFVVRARLILSQHDALSLDWGGAERMIAEDRTARIVKIQNQVEL